MSVTLVLNDEIAALLPQNGEAAEKNAQELIVLELYRRGAVSSGKAAQWLGMSKVEFIRYSGELGIPYFDMTPEEFEAEMKVVESFATKPRHRERLKPAHSTEAD